jgi:beta-glucosidase
VDRADGGVRIAGTRRELRFPEGFLFGCASAAHQVEGGNVNDWSVFERQPGRIKDGSVSGRACEHYQRFRDDLGDYARGGHNAHRFSVEWSRVEPLEGQFDTAALRHYREVIRTCRQLGMEPLVTLHHFTLPLWLADRGGVCAADAPLRFARYAAACAEAFGDDVEWWITVNEPVVMATLGYLQGVWPPGKRSLRAAFAALRGLLRMHAAATLTLRHIAREHRRAARVSVAHHVRGMTPADPSSLLDRATTALPDHLLNRWWLRACADGRMRPPVGAGQTVIGAAGSLDWLGLNYYCDDRVAFDAMRPGSLFARQFPDPRMPLSSFGWAIEPDGLRRALVRVWQQTGLPIVISENGVADVDDELRPQFIVDHLAAVRLAIDEGVDVRGYMLWTGMDNFEWAEGYAQRFGLFAVDRTTMERRAKPSAAVFARICRSGAIPADLLDGDREIAAEQ